MKICGSASVNGCRLITADQLQRTKLFGVLIIGRRGIFLRGARDAEQRQCLKIAWAGVDRQFAAKTPGDASVNIGKLRRCRPGQPFVVDMEKCGLAAQPDMRMAEQIEAAMAKHEHLQVLFDARALCPEDLLPAMRTDPLP